VFATQTFYRKEDSHSDLDTMRGDFVLGVFLLLEWMKMNNLYCDVVVYIIQMITRYNSCQTRRIFV